MTSLWNPHSPLIFQFPKALPHISFIYIKVYIEALFSAYSAASDDEEADVNQHVSQPSPPSLKRPREADSVDPDAQNAPINIQNDISSPSKAEIEEERPRKVARLESFDSLSLPSFFDDAEARSHPYLHLIHVLL